MKKLFKFLKRTGLILLSLLVILIIVVVITGIPKPFATSTINVPRIDLSYASVPINLIKENKDLTIFYTWGVGNKMYVFKMGQSGFSRELHQINTTGMKTQQIKGFPEYATSLRFNPNPEKQEFLYSLDNNGDEQYQLFKFDMTSGTTTQLTTGNSENLSSRYHPSGEWILYQKRIPESENAYLYKIDLQNPDVEELILEMEGLWSIDSWSPDGNRLALRKFISATQSEPFILDLSARELAPLIIDPQIAADYNWIEWSNDSDKLFYSSSYLSDTKKLRVHYLDTGIDTVLIKNLNWEVTYALNSPNGKWLAIVVNEDGLKRLYTHNLLSGETKDVKMPNIGNVSDVEFNSNNVIGFNLYNPSMRADIFTYDPELEKLKKLTNSEEENSLPDPKIIQYPTFDIDPSTHKPRSISAFYHMPPVTAKKPYPVIIDVHGGPKGQATVFRQPEWHYQLTKGYAFLVPNVRGSSGYGDTFTNLDNGILREDAVKDIGALLEWIKEHPDLDESRVVVQGGSYGGYMALASAVHYSDRILGAIDLFGMSNFISQLEGRDKILQDYDKVEYGDIKNPEMRVFLEKISPLNNIDKIEVPLLIYQGENDPRVPVNESRQMVEKLRAEGKAVWYIEAADAGHSFGTPWNAIYTNLTKLKFVDQLMEEQD